jgi:hypothetical protein
MYVKKKSKVWGRFQESLKGWKKIYPVNINQKKAVEHINNEKNR